jgi:hypothetical protein
MKKKLNTLSEAINNFNLAKNILREDYGVGPREEYEDEEGGYPEQGPDLAHYRGGNDHMQQQQGQNQQQCGDEENTDMNLSKSDERIAQIREIALDGLQDYAQDVDCEAYQFYKKIWLMCDKAVSEKDSASGAGGV